MAAVIGQTFHVLPSEVLKGTMKDFAINRAGTSIVQEMERQANEEVERRARAKRGK